MRQGTFDRQIDFFGDAGQQRLAKQTVSIVGVGGLGTHVVQQVALLGVRQINLIDMEQIDHTNRNRYVGIRFDDPIPGMLKVDAAERLVKSINPSIKVMKVASSLLTEAGFSAVQESDFVFGCLDSDGIRFVLNELCAAYARPYIDLASDIVGEEHREYGGRVCCSMDGRGCLVCMDLLDMVEVREDLSTLGELRDRDKIYGVSRLDLRISGPSVVSINGVVASLGVTEFMLHTAGVRRARRLLKYYGSTGKVVSSTDTPRSDCWYCIGIRGTREASDVDRYLTQLRHADTN